MSKLAEYPVVFDAVRNTTYYDPDGTVIPYEYLMTNIGGGMTLEGTFTVPLAGVYFFDFYFTESSYNIANVVHLRVNEEIAAFRVCLRPLQHNRR